MPHQEEHDQEELDQEELDQEEHTHEDTGDSDWSAVTRALDAAKAQQGEGEDPPPFSVLSSAGLELAIEKVPLENAANLLLMREAAAEIRRDQITKEEYLAKVKVVATVAENGIKLFTHEVFKKEAEKLPPDQLELVQRFEKQIYVLKEGTDLMALYAETDNIDDLDKGLALVEKAMADSDHIQDLALEKAAILRAAEKEEAAAKEAAGEGETQA